MWVKKLWISVDFNYFSIHWYKFLVLSATATVAVNLSDRFSVICTRIFWKITQKNPIFISDFFSQHNRCSRKERFYTSDGKNIERQRNKMRENSRASAVKSRTSRDIWDIWTQFSTFVWPQPSFARGNVFVSNNARRHE